MEKQTGRLRRVLSSFPISRLCPTFCSQSELDDSHALEVIEEGHDIAIIHALIGTDDDVEPAVFLLLFPGRRQQRFLIDERIIQPERAVPAQGDNVLCRRLLLCLGSKGSWTPMVRRSTMDREVIMKKTRRKNMTSIIGIIINDGCLKYRGSRKRMAQSSFSRGTVSRAEKHSSISVMIRSRRWVK